VFCHGCLYSRNFRETVLRETGHCRIFNAIINFELLLSVYLPKHEGSRHDRMCIQTEGGHFEHLFRCDVVTQVCYLLLTFR
jgi:hypothetical protein